MFETVQDRARSVVVVVASVLALAVGLLAPPVPASAAYSGPVEDYASYEPAKACADRVKPGTKKLARWINRRWSGGYAHASLRACPESGPSSEHHAGRAIDWSMDATRKRDRREVRRFLQRLLSSDRKGNEHALARRAGVMYVIWNDRIRASYNRFEAREYRSSSCRRLRKCSPTLRHRDHVHISLSRKGAKARTSWYLPRR